MKLARIRLNDGSQRVAAVHDNTVQPLDLTQIDACHSLMDILNSADPAGLARFLLKPDTQLLAFSDIQFHLQAQSGRKDGRVGSSGVTL